MHFYISAIQDDEHFSGEGEPCVGKKGCCSCQYIDIIAGSRIEICISDSKESVFRLVRCRYRVGELFVRFSGPAAPTAPSSPARPCGPCGPTKYSHDMNATSNISSSQNSLFMRFLRNGSVFNKARSAIFGALTKLGENDSCVASSLYKSVRLHAVQKRDDIFA